MPSHSRPSSDIVFKPTHYLVGPDATGRWLAVETHGFGGGIFVTRDAALRYARRETDRRQGGVDVVERLVAFAG